ncbi:Mini-ribonuclease 3 [Enterocloster lavalensis]|uniref:Mini-ribonuclease 3 n=1 Tax=Enterocloster lavalensis TaxID=460384 RepID=UPI0023F56350|nr:ribonuclease III domain-containing protein [Enterocloster lavalensis]
MEESVTFSDFLEYYKKSMGLEPVDVRSYSPLVLAYIGDAVYELMIRSKVINHGSMQVNKMHKHSAALVKASAQAQLIKALQEELTEEELAAYKRGRNAKSATMAKHATMIDYRMATGLEALVGWLFLTEQYARLVELVSRGLVKAGLLEPWDEKGETEG